MNKEYALTQDAKNDLMKTTDACVDFIFKKSQSFLERNNIPQDCSASIPVSVAFTILNSLVLQTASTSKESLESLQAMIRGNIEQIFKNVELDNKKVH